MRNQDEQTDLFSTQETRDLERVVRAPSPRFLRLPGRLESIYQEHVRADAQRTRLALVALPWLICLSSPLWGAALFSLPDALAGWLEVVEFRLIVPMFLALTLLQWFYGRSPFTEWLLMAGFIAISLLVEWMRYEGASYGWRLEPLLTTTMPIAVIALSRIRIARMLLFLGAYLLMIALADQFFRHPVYQRSPSTWLAEWILLAIMALAYAYTQYAHRKAWAYAMLFRAQAGTDPLTSLRNRRSLELHYQQVGAALKRHPAPVSMIAIDIDHFKLINDCYGHAYGDGVLTAFAARLQAFAQRPLDAAVRMGGDEFVLLLPECDGPAALRIAEQLVESIRALALDNRESPYGVLTISAGVATGLSHPPLWELLRKADAALYRAKHQRRNCTVAFEARMLDLQAGSHPEIAVSLRA